MRSSDQGAIERRKTKTGVGKGVGCSGNFKPWLFHPAISMFFELKKKRVGVGFCEFQALNISVLFEYSSLAFYFQVTYDRDGVKTTVTKTIITDGGRGGQLISKKRKKNIRKFLPV